MSGTIKESVAKIFDSDKEVNKQMVLSLDPVLVAPFLHGWCLKAETCKTICEVAKTRRMEAVTILKDGILAYIRDRDETQTNIIEEFRDIIDAFENAYAGEKANAVINLLRKRLEVLNVAGCSALGTSSQENLVSQRSTEPTASALEPPGTSAEFSKAVAEIKNVFVEQFETINPLPFDGDIELKLDECWINLELTNKKLKSSTTDKRDCLAMVNEAFRLRKVVLCKGAPGCGKSTLCNYLCYQWGNGNWNDFDLVLFARLRDIQKSDSILEVAVSWMCDFTNIFDDKEILLKMANKIGKNTLVILDGYDENTEVCSQLVKLLESEYHHLSFNLLLTSCSWAIDEERIKYKGKAQTLVISPLVLNQQEEYAHKIIEDEHKVLILMAKLNKKYDTDLKELAQNILLFSYICFYCITQKGNDFILPFTNVDELYSELFARLVDRYEEKKNTGIERNWETSEQIRCLGKMAMFGCGSKKAQFSFTLNDLHKFNIDECHCTGAGLLIKNSYIKTGASPVVYYSFAHRTAQEFLARKFMVDVYSEIDAEHFIKENVFNFLEAAKSHPDAKDVVDQLYRAVDYFNVELLIMARNDRRYAVPVALITMGMSDEKLFDYMDYCNPPYYYSNLRIQLRNISDESPGVPMSRVIDAYKKYICNAISYTIQNGTFYGFSDIAPFLDLCHDVDMEIVSVLENKTTGEQSDTLLYFSSLNALCYATSSDLEGLEHPLPSVEISRLLQSAEQQITTMGIHGTVSKDWLSITSLPLRHIGCIHIYQLIRPFEPSLLLECSTPVAQSHTKQEGGITLSELRIHSYRPPPPPVLSSSIKIHNFFFFLEHYIPSKWNQVSATLDRYDTMQLNGKLINSLSFRWAAFKLKDFLALFKNLQVVDLRGLDLHDEEPMSEIETQAFVDCIKSLGPNVTIKYNEKTRLGQILHTALSRTVETPLIAPTIGPTSKRRSSI